VFFVDVHAIIPEYVISVACRAVYRLYEFCGMVQVMDPGQMLFTELYSRFPEVPVDIIKFIMQQVCLLCKPDVWINLLNHCYLRRRRRLCFRCGLFVCLSVCVSVCLFVCLSVELLGNL